jgi:serine/threonine protein kinase
MTLDADLAACGEPSARPDEQEMAEFLERALRRLENGEPLQDTDLPSEQLRRAGQDLLAELQRLRSAADSVWEHSGVLMDSEEETERPDPFPGEFRVGRWLGGGAFGEVWLAEDLTPLHRPVALKFLKVGRHGGERALEALRNDARLLAELHHPNVLAVYAWRQAAAGPVLVLQYAAGGSLADRVRASGPLPWHLAARYVADAADGLLAAHLRGIIHRDVKPDNLLWDPDRDEALVTDFGIAARLGDPAARAGTPAFMAPEAFRGRLSAALDTYGLAASLFWLTTRAVPFPAPTEEALVLAIERGLPKPEPRCAGLPASLENLIRAGLAARPEDRPALADFAAALRSTLNLLLADTLQLPPTEPAAPVRLGLLVSLQAGPQSFVPVAATAPPTLCSVRDMQKVPAEPAQVRLRTGDRVRLEVEADQPGYVSVFNVGPTGNLHLLYPAEPPAAGRWPPLAANSPLHILDVQLTPPQGRERLFALWCREPLSLGLDELASLSHSGTTPVSGAYRATRDMVRVRRSWEQVPPQDRHVIVLEVDHY